MFVRCKVSVFKGRAVNEKIKTGINKLPCISISHAKLLVSVISWH